MIRTFGAVLLCAAIAVPLSACSGSKSSSSGASITIAGSTALLPLAKAATADYQVVNPDAKISVSGGGSRLGIAQASQKGIDIGNSDIPAPQEPSLVDHEVAIVQFDIAVNPESGITNLTTAQIRAIFSGKVTNFNQVGGKDVAITIVNRPQSSGTRAVFVEKINGGAQPLAGSITQDSSGTVASIIEQTPGAITYVANSYVKGGQIIPISIDGITPGEAAIKNGKYAFWSYEHMFTNGPPSPAVAAFIAFVKGDTVALRRLGFIPTSALKKP